MNENLTELVFILDKSGSMHGLEEDTIGGYNSMLEKQKAEKGDVRVTTVLFDNHISTLFDRMPISCVEPITKKEYQPGGTTALLDAVGETVTRINKIQNGETEAIRPGKTIFVITTDGYENASHEYSYQKVKALVESQQKELNWEFIFLGANIDAMAEGSKLGIAPDRSASYHNDSQGISTNFEALSDAVSFLRCSPIGSRMDGSWKRRIDEDYKSRSDKK